MDKSEDREWLTKFLLLVIAVLLFAYYYDDKGHNDQMERVRDEAYSEGYSSGYSDGEENGREIGYDDGYGEGYNDGYYHGGKDLYEEIFGKKPSHEFEVEEEEEEEYIDIQAAINYFQDPFIDSQYETPNSTEFSKIGYYKGVLAVTFRESGKRYYYYHLPLVEWEDFRDAESLGKYFNEWIKPYYDYTTD